MEILRTTVSTCSCTGLGKETSVPFMGGLDDGADVSLELDPSGREGALVTSGRMVVGITVGLLVLGTGVGDTSSQTWQKGPGGSAVKSGEILSEQVGLHHDGNSEQLYVK